jgi:maleylacetate reductase
VLTVGGGSAIGLGKVIAVDRGIPVVAVPTTYSGSEMTPVYGITGTRKRTVRDLRALPSVVVYDPELTVGLPRRVTASSGFNALAHCVEGFYAPGASPVVDLWAEEAIASLAEALPELADDPSDLGARSDALYGAYLAGATLAVAGTALHHKLCHVLGGSFGLDHGDVHAVLLPHVAAFNADVAPERLAAAAAALRGPRDAAQVGVRLHDLALRIGAPTSLAEIGMPAEGLAEAAALGVAAVGDSNPCPVDEVAVRRILDAAYEGRSP